MIPAPTRWFDDLVVGESFASDWTSISTEDIIRFAREFDPQSFHIDPEVAATSPFGGLIGSGAHTFALWSRLNLEINGNIAWIAGMGFDEFLFPNPLRPDREFQATSTLLSMRPSESDPARGVTVHHHQLVYRDGSVLFTCHNPALAHRQ